MKCLNEKKPELKNYQHSNQRKNMLQYSLAEQIAHGMDVSNMAYDVAEKLGYKKEECYELAVAGILHDIGKIVLEKEIGDKPLIVEEMKVVRMHPVESYDVVKKQGYSDFIQQSVLHHHENYDGSGYPDHLFGDDIPYGGRILRVCDVYCALTSDRPYRKAYDHETAIKFMVEDIRNFDLKIFLAFQKIIHENNRKAIILGDLTVDERGDFV
mgnify:CR=1 FL=1